MYAAFSYLENRIAPVFDIARHMLIIEADEKSVLKETQEILPDDQPVERVLRMSALRVQVLVCGAISRPFREIVVSYGIQVIPFVAGDLHQVIDAWLCNGLKGNAFAMPGCCDRHKRRFGGVCRRKQ